MRRNPVVVLMFLLAILVSAHAQRPGNFTLTTYNIANGIATNKIHHATQDSLNRLWFATGYGVSIYDGFKWENINLLDPQNNAGFKKIIIDRQGRKWLIPMISTTQVQVDNGNGFTPVKGAPASPPDVELVTDGDIIYPDKNPVIVLATLTKLHIHFKGKWTSINNSNGIFYGVLADGDRFLLAGEKGLFTLTFTKAGKPQIAQHPARITDPLLAVSVLPATASTPRFAILSTGWVGVLNNDIVTKTGPAINIEPVANFQHYYITGDTRGRLYFGNKYIKEFYNPDTRRIEPMRKEQGFTSDGATSVFIDREDNIWFTDLRGIDKITYHPFKNYYTSDGLLEDEVTAAVEYSPGTYIFGHNSGYTILKGTKFNSVSFLQASGKNTEASRVLDLTIDHQGGIWAACGNYGLVKIDPNGSHNRVLKWHTPVTSVLDDKKYGLLVATSDNIYRLKGDKLIQHDPKLGSVNFRKLFRFGNSIYAAAGAGLFLVNGENITSIMHSPDQLAMNVFAVHPAGNDALMVGTERGLLLLANGKVTPYSKNGFGINKAVYFIVQSPDRNLWFGTADGLIRWDGNNTTYEYILQDGLAGYEMNRSAALVDSRNTLWIGTNTGLSTYDLNKREHGVAPPKIWLAGLETSQGEHFSLSTQSIISHTGNSLTFSIRGISYISEDLIKYKIKLEGFDEDYYEITQSQLQNIRYLNLPSGAYRLSVMAKNRFSPWSQPVHSGIILIEKPFHIQTWFILLVITMIAAGVVFGFKLLLTSREHTKLEMMVQERTKALAESEKKLKTTLDSMEELVRQRTEELEKSNKTKDKIFSIISHDLRSPFMTILGYSELLHDEYRSAEPDTIKKYAARIVEASQNTMAMVDGLLEWSKLQIGGIVPTPEETELAAITEQIGNLFRPQVTKKNLSLIIDIDEQLRPVTDPAIISTVIRNLLSNAIKFTPNGGLIKISAHTEGSGIIIEVSDTGIGIPESLIPSLFNSDTLQTRNGTNNEKGTGLGLSIVFNLLQKVNSTISVESSPSSGTTFRVTLPHTPRDAEEGKV